MTGGLKMGVNVAAHTRHIFLGNAPPPGTELEDSGPVKTGTYGAPGGGVGKQADR